MFFHPLPVCQTFTWEWINIFQKVKYSRLDMCNEPMLTYSLATTAGWYGEFTKSLKAEKPRKWSNVWSPTSRIVASLDGSMHDWRCKTRNVYKTKEGRWSLMSKCSGLRGPECLRDLKIACQSTTDCIPMGHKYHLKYISFKWLTYYIHSICLLFCSTFCSIHICCHIFWKTQLF